MAKKIEALVAEGRGSAQIHAELVRLGRLHDDADRRGIDSPDAAPWGENDVPVERTIQRTVKDLRPPEPERKRWEITPDNAEQAVAILRIQAAIIRAHGVRIGLSVSQADWVWAVAKIAPDLPSWWAYRVGMLLWQRSAANAPTADVEMWLAMRPWASAEDAAEYSKAVRTGLIPGSPFGGTDTAVEEVSRIVDQLWKHDGSIPDVPGDFAALRRWLEMHTRSALELRGHDPVVSGQTVVQVLDQRPDLTMSAGGATVVLDVKGGGQDD